MPALIMLAVVSVAAAKIWLALASREMVALPNRGSLLSTALNALDPAPDAAVAAMAVDAALRIAATEDRAGLIFRIEHAQQAIVRALSEQPLQPRLWLARVALLERAGVEDASIAQSMKMVYFTSAASGPLAIERLRKALQLRRLDDSELADLIRADLTVLLVQPGSVRSATMPVEVADAYRNASPAGRALLVGVVAETRPDLLSLLR
ncbi:hypothetical protein [Bradyrhizobium sp. ORS 375]|uniref:hypothetical protein n=1 Tax=Bradyrhizobium sp. (strain ORS 375) TaxID=566679 RepID=UPI0011122A89|nr:hypothetical protein [Bradyrhizobium sp. ORS 375]